MSHEKKQKPFETRAQADSALTLLYKLRDKYTATIDSIEGQQYDQAKLHCSYLLLASECAVEQGKLHNKKSSTEEQLSDVLDRITLVKCDVAGFNRVDTISLEINREKRQSV